MKVGFTCGTFDLLHPGHIMMLQQCKAQCDYLIVAVQTDPTINRPEDKKKPIQNIVERQIQLASCKFVDDVCVYQTEEELLDLLALMPIDVRFLGMDHMNGFLTGEAICKKRKIKMVYLPRDHRFSTSELRERVKMDGQKYKMEYGHMFPSDKPQQENKYGDKNTMYHYYEPTSGYAKEKKING